MNLRWMTTFLLAMCVPMNHGLSVRFKDPMPIYVAQGRVLVLEAVIGKSSGEHVRVTWTHVRSGENETVATFPGESQKSRINIEREGSVLEISDVQETDFGRYTITVTGQGATEKFAEKEVKESGTCGKCVERALVNPPKGSVVFLCDVSDEKSQWDSPVVTWLIDGAKLDNQMVSTSDNGFKLHLQEIKGHNYTCIVDSSLGTTESSIIIPRSTENSNCRACIIALICFGSIFGIIMVAYCLFTYGRRLLGLNVR